MDFRQDVLGGEDRCPAARCIEAQMISSVTPSGSLYQCNCTKMHPKSYSTYQCPWILHMFFWAHRAKDCSGDAALDEKNGNEDKNYIKSATTMMRIMMIKQNHGDSRRF